MASKHTSRATRSARISPATSLRSIEMPRCPLWFPLAIKQKAAQALIETTRRERDGILPRPKPLDRLVGNPDKRPRSRNRLLDDSTTCRRVPVAERGTGVIAELRR